MADYEVKTKKGYDFFQVASAFQKSIRRCDEKYAMYWAAELYESNYAKYAWKRMVIMASEDVGLGEPSLIVQIMALKQAYDMLAEKQEKSHPQKLAFTQAVIALVRSRKSRYMDHAITVYWDMLKTEYLEIPDYAFDMHTRKGKSMGRGLKYFYEESVLINNANKLQGEEDMEERALAIDGVDGISRHDVDCAEYQDFAPTKKVDSTPTLF